MFFIGSKLKPAKVQNVLMQHPSFTDTLPEGNPLLSFILEYGEFVNKERSLDCNENFFSKGALCYSPDDEG